MNEEQGSAAVLLLAVAALVVILTVGVADVGLALAARLQAAAAADAAALAAAPVTFRPFGAPGSPVDEARRFAMANGADLVVCRCPVDRSWRPRVAEVVVERRVALLGIGAVTVRASSRAEFSPAALITEGEP
ncbi:MAG: Rv3654c family TadE-like protein [Acidimicrobiia bacterium]